MITAKRLGVGFVGSGLETRRHLQSWIGVRDADVVGFWSPQHKDSDATASQTHQLDIGAARAYRSITAMVADSAIDALWLCGPSAARLASMEEIADAVIRAKGKLVGVASEVPLADNVADAERMTALAAHAGLKHGYLDSQVFAPSITRGKALLWAEAASQAGRPHLARATGESPPVLLVRYLLTEPGRSLATLRPRRVTGDAAAITIEFETPDGARVRGEARSGGPPSVELNGKRIFAGDEDRDGYTAQNQHYVRAFLGREEPLLTFDDGLDVVRILAGVRA